MIHVEQCETIDREGEDFQVELYFRWVKEDGQWKCLEFTTEHEGQSLDLTEDETDRFLERYHPSKLDDPLDNDE